MKMKFLKSIYTKVAGVLAGVTAMVGSASAAIDVTNITQNIDDLGSILAALVTLLQTVIVDNIGIFITIIILMVLLFIIKRFGWSFADFFEGILGGLFREENRR